MSGGPEPVPRGLPTAVRHPAELLRLSDVDAIEAELLDGLVPAVNRDRGPAAPGERCRDVPAEDAL